MIDLKALRDRWLVEKPMYERLGSAVAVAAQHAMRSRGIAAEVKHRAKDVAEFLKKALRKDYEDAWAQITDKAGARIVVSYADEVPRADEAIAVTFDVIERVDKALSFNELGYQGVHYQLRLRDGGADLDGLSCEVQLVTRAQSLWSDVSHALLYKPTTPPPVQVARSLYRLVALVEIFDDAVMKARETIRGMPGFEAASLLSQLERHFFRFTGRQFDRQLSLEVLGALAAALQPEDVARYSELIDAFVSKNDDKLREIFAGYEHDTREGLLLLFQPEALLLFEQLERDKFRLKEQWIASYPPELLENLAAVWGSPFPGAD